MPEMRLLDETWKQRWTSQAITFDEAVVAAAEVLDGTGVFSSSGQRTAETFLTLFVLQALEQNDEDEIDQFMREAQEVADYHHALCRAASSYIDDGEVIPEPLATFTVKVLDGRTKVPKRPRGRHPHENFYRDLVTCFSIDRLVSIGLTATRNRISEADSACDVVSQALSSLGIALPYTTVETIWRNRRSSGFFGT